MIIRSTTYLAVLLLIGCGGARAPDPTTSPISDDPTTVTHDRDDSVDGPASCEGHSLGDPCITEQNLAQCREKAAECPGEVLMLESCPLQFACP